MTSLVRSIIFTAILTVGTAIAVQAQVNPTVTVPAIAPVGIGASTSLAAFSQPFCDGQLDGGLNPVPRGIYTVGGGLLKALPASTVCAENYFAVASNLGGFTAGDLFVFDASTSPVPPASPSGRIIRFPAGGGPFSVFNAGPFAGDHVGPNFDRVGTFANGLIVTGDFGVRVLNAAGAVIAFYPTPDINAELENSEVAPLSFTPCPGCLFMVTEPKTPTFGKIWVIHPGAASGTAPQFFATGPVAPEAIHFPEANACTVSINGVGIEYLASGYTKPPGNVNADLTSAPPFGAILGWTPAQMAPFIGKAIVADESSGDIFAYNGPDITPGTPDATVFSNTGAQLEGNTVVVCPPPPPPENCNIVTPQLVKAAPGRSIPFTVTNTGTTTGTVSIKPFSNGACFQIFPGSPQQVQLAPGQSYTFMLVATNCPLTAGKQPQNASIIVTTSCGPSKIVQVEWMNKL